MAEHVDYSGGATLIPEPDSACNTKNIVVSREGERPQHGGRLGDDVASGRVLKFISRAEHLAWRARWKKGRWVKLSWTPEQRDAILRQDEAYGQADARWELIHGPVPGGASILHWRREPDAVMQIEEALRANATADEVTG
jgi:hypothetical protein